MTVIRTLVGMFYLQDHGETYITGQFVGGICEHTLIAQPDVMHEKSGMPFMPMHMVSTGEMCEPSPNGGKVYELFHTREDLDAWLAYLNAPSSPSVLSIVPKGKGA